MTSEECTCPTCRYSRGEITYKELAWYLKGKIEAAYSVLAEMGRYGSSKSIFKNVESNLRYIMDSGEEELSEFIKNLDKIDPAWTQPRNYTLK